MRFCVEWPPMPIIATLCELRQRGAEAGVEEIVLAELRLDNAWRELYAFMELPLSLDARTGDGSE